MRRGNYYPAVYAVKEDSDPSLRLWFLSHLVEDRGDSALSYQQFLQLLKDRVSYSFFQQKEKEFIGSTIPHS